VWKAHSYFSMRKPLSQHSMLELEKEEEKKTFGILI
jgi:hypothetical protein